MLAPFWWVDSSTFNWTSRIARLMRKTSVATVIGALLRENEKAIRNGLLPRTTAAEPPRILLLPQCRHVVAKQGDLGRDRQRLVPGIIP
jgi:hypothetical protein